MSFLSSLSSKNIFLPLRHGVSFNVTLRRGKSLNFCPFVTLHFDKGRAFIQTECFFGQKSGSLPKKTLRSDKFPGVWLKKHSVFIFPRTFARLMITSFQIPEKYFSNGATIRACMNSPLRSISFTSSFVKKWISRSSVASRC